MKKNRWSFTILLSILLLWSCSSVDSDAKKAAELNKKSMDYIIDNDLEKAAEIYNESQAIVARYKGTEQYNEFYTAYSKYMKADQPVINQNN